MSKDKIPTAEEFLEDVDADSISELFSSKPPFNKKIILALVHQLRQKRKVWQKGEDAKARKGGRKAGYDPKTKNLNLKDLGLG